MTLLKNNNLREFVKAYLAGRKRSFALVGLLTLLLGATEGVGLLLILPMLEIMGAGDGGSTSRISQLFQAIGLPRDLVFLLVVFVVLVSIRAVLTRFARLHDSRLQYAFLTDLRNRFFRAATYANWVFFSKTRGSDLLQALTSDLNRVGMGAFYLGRVFGSALMAGVYIFLTLVIAPVVSMVAFCAGLALVLALRSGFAAARNAGAGLTHHHNEFYAAAGEHFQGMKTVKSFGLEDSHIRRFERSTQSIMAQIITFYRLQTGTRMWFEIGAVVLLAGIVYIGSMRAPVQQLLVLILLYARLMPRISDLVGDFQQLMHMLPAWQSAQASMQECLAASEPVADDATRLPKLQKHIRFEFVNFGYAGNEAKRALSDVTLDIPARCTTAIIGESGAGKSTFADLLMGLVQPDSGKICIDDEPLKAGMIGSWRRVLGYVPQETWLFNDSVRANLTWAAPHAGGAEIWEALEKAAAADFVAKLAHGDETNVGDRGVLLSGGERQRLALARALLRKPELLVLDEATSALDSVNEEKIIRAIDQLHGGITIVMIAHRLSTVHHADYVIVLDKGEVVEQGRRLDLAADASSRFARMMRHADQIS